MKSYDIWLSPPEQVGTELEWVGKALDTRWITTAGPLLEMFEQKIAHYVGRKYGLAVQSGTAAIHLACLLVGVQPDTDVLIPSLTFAATAFPVVYIGANPVFVDVEPNTWNLSPEWLETAIVGQRKKNRTVSAVIAVDLFGVPADYQAIQAICQMYEIPLITDAAESLGSSIALNKTGSFGEIGVFSFNGNKIMTTGGGGMLVTDDEALWKKARKLATQAREPVSWYEHKEIGYNYRMSHLSAAIGLAQMEGLEQKINQKQAIYQFYEKKLSSFLKFKTLPNAFFSNHWLTTAVLPEPYFAADLVHFLAKERIEARQVWKPLHQQPIFEHCSYYGSDLPEYLFQQGVCLPSGTGLMPIQQEEIIAHVFRFLASK